MQQPAWKRWLSYLVEWHLESAPSELNPHLYVSLRRGRYQLSTARALYSFGDLYSNFSKSFDRLDLERLPGDEVLLLGLGLGSVPYMLEHRFGQSLHYTAVELDESVIYLASKYTLPDIHSPVDVICANAEAFVYYTEEQYALIAMDVFVDDQVPSEFESEEFLQALAECLLPGGLLMYNRLALTEADKKQSLDFFEGPFKKQFPNALYFDVQGNYMLLNGAHLNK